MNDLMSQTFSLRRQEVLSEGSNVATLLDRPFSQICQEFQRLIGISLSNSRINVGSKHTAKMLSLFNSKCGALGEKMTPLIMELVQNPSSTAEERRDILLRCHMVWIGENQADLICDNQTSGFTEDLGYPVMIFTSQETYGIVTDGQPVLKGLPALAKSGCLLVGIIYALDLNIHPKSSTLLRYSRDFLWGKSSAPKTLQ